MLDRIEEFKIGDRVESDHLPLQHRDKNRREKKAKREERRGKRKRKDENNN